VPADGELEIEARVFARYLVGRVPQDELVARYLDASRAIFVEEADPREAAVLAFARRRPWSVPFLDAAAGFLRPGSLLRNKILLMGAILETSPAFADEFLPRNVGTAGLVLRILALGTAAAARAALGAPLLAAATRLHARG
jgi:hypothetical protein